MNKGISITFFFIFTGAVVLAQDTTFVFAGKVEYEKSVNMYAVLRKVSNNNTNIIMQATIERYKSTQPQFQRYKSTLIFDKTQTLFAPAKQSENRADAFYALHEIASQPNVVFTDIAAKKSITQKTIFEKVFLLSDSTKKIKWKLTDETRQIAGFTCRRINALVLDSIYVVAFYAERIPVPSGPEAFTGAPGLILQVTLPHENVSWIATKILRTPIEANELVPPRTGTSIDKKQVKEKLLATIKDDNNYFPLYLKMLSL